MREENKNRGKSSPTVRDTTLAWCTGKKIKEAEKDRKGIGPVSHPKKDRVREKKSTLAQKKKESVGGFRGKG